MREAVSVTEAVHVPKNFTLETARKPHYTDGWGGVPDHYRVPFTRPDGHATLSQTLFIPGFQATQNVTVRANGSYEIEPAVATFH